MEEIIGIKIYLKMGLALAMKFKAHLNITGLTNR
jgi:hypothetical protein